MPSRPGISTSSRATSGRCSSDGRHHLVAACRPRRRRSGRARGRAGRPGRRAPAPGRRRAAAGSSAHRTLTGSANPRGSSVRVTSTRRRPRRPARAARRARARAATPSARAGRRRRRTSTASGLEPHRAAAGAAVPDHVGDALAHRPREQLAQVAGHLVGAVRQVGVDVGGLQRLAGAGQLAGQGQLAVALHRPAHVGQSASRLSRSRSATSRLARTGSTSSSRPASSALTVITVSEWPRMSCRSRANRLRSSATASRRVLLARAASGRGCGPSAAGRPTWRRPPRRPRTSGLGRPTQPADQPRPSRSVTSTARDQRRRATRAAGTSR